MEDDSDCRRGRGRPRLGRQSGPPHLGLGAAARYEHWHASHSPGTVLVDAEHLHLLSSGDQRPLHDSAGNEQRHHAGPQRAHARSGMSNGHRTLVHRASPCCRVSRGVADLDDRSIARTPKVTGSTLAFRDSETGTGWIRGASGAGCCSSSPRCLSTYCKPYLAAQCCPTDRLQLQFRHYFNDICQRVLRLRRHSRLSP